MIILLVPDSTLGMLKLSRPLEMMAATYCLPFLP